MPIWSKRSLTWLKKIYRSQAGIFMILTFLFACTVFYGVKEFISSEQIWEYTFLYLINGAVFLALYRQYPKLGLAMLTFILFFELAVFGYFYFSSVSLLG